MNEQMEKIVLAIAKLLRENSDVHGYVGSFLDVLPETTYRRVGEKISPRDHAIIAAASTETECLRAIGAYSLMTDGIAQLRRVYESFDIKDLRFDFLAEKSDEEIKELRRYEDGGPTAYVIKDELDGPASDPYLVEQGLIAIAWRRINAAEWCMQAARALLNDLSGVHS